MKLSVSAASAHAAMCAAVAAQLFLTLMLDFPATRNGAWLSALLAGLAAMPVALMLIHRENRPVRRVFKPSTATFMAAALLDAAETMRCVTRSAGFLALDEMQPVWLLLPVALAMYWCVGKNGDALGYAASVWLKIFPLLLVLVVAMQLRHLRPDWLFPLFGSGGRALAGGALHAAGGAATLCGALLLQENTGKPGKVLGALAISAAVAAVLIALQLAMLPTSRDASALSWIDRLDGLITNGRAPLYLQLPMMILWFAALFHLLAWNCFLSAALMQRLLPGMNGRACVLIVVLAASLLSGQVDSLGPLFRLRWIVLAAAAAAGLLFSRVGGGRGICVDSH